MTAVHKNHMPISLYLQGQYVYRFIDSSCLSNLNTYIHVYMSIDATSSANYPPVVVASKQ